MKTYNFTIILGGVTHITSELVDKLYEAGCNDGLITQKNGRVLITFDRRGDDYVKAVLEAVHQLEYIVLNDGTELEVLEIEGY